MMGSVFHHSPPIPHFPHVSIIFAIVLNGVSLVSSRIDISIALIEYATSLRREQAANHGHVSRVGGPRAVPVAGGGQDDVIPAACTRPATESVPLEHWRALLHEGAIGTLEILAAHALGLPLGLEVDRAVNVHRPFFVQTSLRHGMRR